MQARVGKTFDGRKAAKRPVNSRTDNGLLKVQRRNRELRKVVRAIREVRTAAASAQDAAIQKLLENL